MKCLALIRAEADVRPLTAVGGWGRATVEVDHKARKKNLGETATGG